jgi:hypothetical protein
MAGWVVSDLGDQRVEAGEVLVQRGTLQGRHRCVPGGRAEQVLDLVAGGGEAGQCLVERRAFGQMAHASSSGSGRPAL